MTTTGIILIAVAVVIIPALILVSYVKAPPSIAFIVSGLSKNPNNWKCRK